MVELTQQLESERQNKLVLAKEPEDQGLITKATELAFSTQTELINAKNEIIQNFKIIISQHKKDACSCRPLNEGDLTSHLEPTNSRTENKNGVQDCVDFIKIQATNGVVLNGLLLWADIERKTTAENIWKTQAISKFDKDEISEAKIELWRIYGESTLGKLVKRQGSGKAKSELDDICIA